MKSYSRKLDRRCRHESLESRVLLDAGGVSARMTLSFVPEGTEVSSQQSSLVAAFGDVATENEWQTAIEQAFNQWTVNTNADIGVVANDSGDPLGTPGRREGDDRFGDIRIAAVPLGESVKAISFPRDNVAVGTWANDIIFNSDADWSSLDEITSVALHEAGHIFGLEHSTDSSSAMYTHGVSNVTSLNTADIANMQFLFGGRVADRNELETQNDDPDNATSLSPNLASDSLVLSYGDITTPGDVDFFRLDTEEEIEDEILIQVRTDGFSLLSPVVRIYNEDGDQLAEEVAEDGMVTLEYEFEDEEDGFLISVQAADDSPVAVGAYAIAISLDSEEFEDEDYEDFLDGDFDLFDADEVARYLRGDDDDYDLEDDENSDDEVENAVELSPVSFNAGRVWYEQAGSISNANDADVYELVAPDDEGGIRDVMTVNVRSLKANGLIPRIEIFNSDQEAIPFSTVLNGNGESVVQVSDVELEESYFVIVTSATPDGSFARGHYELLIDFGSEAVELAEFSSGTLSAANPVQARLLHVATPQLFHFLLAVESQTDNASVPVSMDIFDQLGNSVYSVTAFPWQIRSGANPFLQPGTYTIRVGYVALTGELPELNYELVGTAVSNPLGIVPIDPVAEPVFQCDGVSDQFCYPGGTTTDSPFFWDTFIQNYIDQKNREQDRGGVTNGDWWDWYWGIQQQAQPNPVPPNASADDYRVRNGDLVVTVSQGVLRNDSSTSTAPLQAAVAVETMHGSLNLHANGAFHYTPDPGFFGIDSFVYEVTDFVAMQTATVTLHISQPGDADGDGRVAFADFLTVSANFGTIALGQEATWEDGDYDGDGIVGFSDFLIVSANFGSTVRARRTDTTK